MLYVFNYMIKFFTPFGILQVHLGCHLKFLIRILRNVCNFFLELIPWLKSYTEFFNLLQNSDKNSNIVGNTVLTSCTFQTHWNETSSYAVYITGVVY